MSKKLKERREKMLHDNSRPDPKHVAVPASKRPTFTGSDFEDALKKASSKIAEPESEKKQKA